MKDEDNIENEFKGFSEEMNGLKGKQEFKLPANYFENMQVNVQNQISKEKSWMHSGVFKLASLSLSLLIVGVFVWKTFQTDPSTGLNDSDYYAFVEEEIDEYSIETLCEEIELETIDELVEEVGFITDPDSIKKNEELKINVDSNEIDLDLSDDDLIEYFIEEDYDGYEI